MGAVFNHIMLNEVICMLSEAFIPQPVAAVKSVISVRRFICQNASALSRSAPDTWMLIYVDSGELFLTTQYRRCYLFGGELLLLCPAEAPALFTLKAPPSLVVCTFLASSPPPYALSDQSLYAAKSDRFLLTQLLANALSLSTGSPVIENILPDIMETLLTRLFNRLSLRLRPFSLPAAPMQPPPTAAFLNQYFRILHYLKFHLDTRLSVEKICKDNLIGRSGLEKLFHRGGWNGVMDCFFHLKINAAKRLIASGVLTFTQISAMLGYSSVHYFSRQFKKRTKMTPTEYASFLRKHPGDVIPSFFF